MASPAMEMCELTKSFQSILQTEATVMGGSVQISPEKSFEGQGVPVSPEGVKRIYEDVIGRLTRLESHAKLFLRNMYDMNLGAEMKMAMTSDPPPVEMLILFEQVAAQYTPPPKRKRNFSMEGRAATVRQTTRYRPKLASSLKGKKLSPKTESSSSSDFQNPPKKNTAVPKQKEGSNSVAKKLIIPKLEKSSSNEFQSPTPKMLKVADDSSVEMME